MEAPEVLSWDVLQARLTEIMVKSPPPWAIQSRQPCALPIIRLRDIARYCGIERADIYRIRRGDRPRLLKSETQVRLSWFFSNLDRGKLVKEKGADGLWRIFPRREEPKIPGHAQDASQAGVSAQISVGPHGPTLKVIPR